MRPRFSKYRKRCTALRAMALKPLSKATNREQRRPETSAHLTCSRTSPSVLQLFIAYTYSGWRKLYFSLKIPCGLEICDKAMFRKILFIALLFSPGVMLGKQHAKNVILFLG